MKGGVRIINPKSMVALAVEDHLSISKAMPDLMMVIHNPDLSPT